MSGEFVRIVEVGPRDGLQNEPFLISAVDKIHLVNLLSAARLPSIEVTSFVSPKWVPQMADATEVLAGIQRSPEVRYSVLVPNLQGYRAAFAAGVNEVSVFTTASEDFSRKNINCTIAESIERFMPVVDAAKNNNMPIRGYVSCVVDCPYAGKVDSEDVARLTQTLLEMGCYEVSLGDTTGMGTPDNIRAMLLKVLEVAPPEKLAGHFHDTGKQALKNIEESLALGLRTFDASVGGLGGCPYAPGATGNVATEDVVGLLHQRGYKTGVDVPKLIEAKSFVSLLKQQHGTC